MTPNAQPPQILKVVVSTLGLGLALLLCPALTEKAGAQAAAVGYYGPYRPIVHGYTPFEPAGFGWIINYGPVFPDSWRHIPPAVLTNEERLRIQQQNFVMQLRQQQAQTAELTNMMHLETLTNREPDPFALPDPDDEPEEAPLVEAVRKPDLFDADGRLLWPVTTPADMDLDPRFTQVQRTSEAVRRQFLADGQADPEAVQDAREKLYEYGRPLLKRLSARGDHQRHDTLLPFVRALDAELIEMGNPPAEPHPEPEPEPEPDGL
ncbi:hypothetical protein BH23PLA1_BH23PLA1_06270 [soil metagenome]